MIKLPFTPATFSQELKQKLSGSNLTLDYRNIESTLCRTAVEIGELIGPEVYDAVVDLTISADESLAATVKDCLQRAMLHLTLYHHAIYLIANIGNDGITVKKTDDATTIYKYQQDDLEMRLISDGWFWFNRLLVLLNDNPTKSPLWQMRYNYLKLDDLPVTPDDFARYVGVKDTYFVFAVLWIINEVWTSEVESRVCHISGQPDLEAKVKRAVCYNVVGLAVERLAFFYLPETIRKDINNEQAKKNSTAEDVKTRVAGIYLTRAQNYWSAIDTEIKSRTDLCPDHVSPREFQPSPVTENNSFCL